MEKAYKNTGYFILLLFPLVAIGFYVTYFSNFPTFDQSFSALTHSKVGIFDHIHAIAASLWVVLLVVQPLLIRSGNVNAHKMLGQISYIFFPLLIISFYTLIQRMLASEYPILAYIPISDSTVLIILYGLAVYKRRDTPQHMRYMIGTATVFLGPTFGRIGPTIFDLDPGVTNNLRYITVYLILAGLVLFDWKHSKQFKPYLVMMLLVFVEQIGFNILL